MSADPASAPVTPLSMANAIRALSMDAVHKARALRQHGVLITALRRAPVFPIESIRALAHILPGGPPGPNQDRRR